MLDNIIPHNRKENLQSLKDTFQQLIFFLKNPNQIDKVPQPIEQRLRSIRDLFVIKWLLTLVWTIFATPVILIFQSRSETVISTDSSILGLLIVSVVLGPLIEETIYRLPLIFKPIYLGLAVGLTTYVITSYYLLEISIWDLEHYFSYRLLSALIMTALVIWVVKEIPDLDMRFKMRLFPFFFYFSAIAFGLSHFEDLREYNFLYLSVMLVPYIISGIIFGVVRIMHGFRYALVLHSFNNLVAVTVPMLINLLIIS